MMLIGFSICEWSPRRRRRGEHSYIENAYSSVRILSLFSSSAS